MKYPGKLFFLFIVFFILCSFINAQNYPQNYFRSPLNIPLQLAANFGELRADHFHMGLDIRTQGKENLPVFAAADGYVSRVEVSEYGFGKAIFIVHPNGYTTVYGHLNNFFPALNDFVKNKQYEDESWQQDDSLQPGLFKVFKGQLIAYSGNTGASAGPHLHFEIRDSKTGNNLNPELFGFNIPDKIPPAIYSLSWYDRRYSTYQSGPKTIAVKGKAGIYNTVNKVIKIGSPLISLGISAEDKNETSPFMFGIYSAELRLDDSLIFAFELSNISYDETRYVNACIDYKTWASSKKYIQHLSILPGNDLPIFTSTPSRGLIIINDTSLHNISVNISDVYGRTSNINFQIQYSDSLQQNISYTPNAKPILPDQENVIHGNYFEAAFRKNAFYDGVPFTFSESLNKMPNTASPLIVLHNYLVPVHNRYTIKIKTSLPANDSLRNRTIMQFVSGNHKDIVKGEWQGDWMQSSSRRLGNIQLVTDTIPPVIQFIGWKNGLKILSTQRSLHIKCTDNMEEVESFKATLDGQWLMFVKKSNDFIYSFDEHCTKGPHQLVITVSDVAGNISEQSFSFTKN